MTDALVGREEELAALRSFLDAVPDGPSAAVLEGDAGIGKTALWSRALDEARSRSYRVLSSRPGERETDLSFTGLADLIGGVIDEVLEALPGPQRHALGVAVLREAPGDDPPEARAVSTAFDSALSILSRSGPVVLGIDDLQWLDVPSARAIEFALRRAGDSPIGIVVTLRTGRDRPSPPPDIERLVPAGRTTRRELGPLSLGALHRVIRERFGVPLPRPTLVAIERASGGNPFFALEMARAVLREGSGSLAGRDVPIPATLSEAVLGRIRSLSPPARRMLLELSAMTQPTVAMLRRLYHEDGSTADDRLVEAEEADVVQVDAGGRIRFSHPLLASTVYSSAGTSQRKRAHERLAAIVADPEERARHLSLAASGPDGAVAAELERTAGLAIARGAPGDAADLLSRSVRATPPERRAEAARRRVRMARSLLEAGDTRAAASALREAMDDLPSGRERGEALLLLGITDWYGESAPEAVARLEHALIESAGDRLLEGRLHAYLALFYDFDHARAAQHGEAAVELLDGGGDPAMLAFALFQLLEIRAIRGQGAHWDLLERGLALEPTVNGWEASTIPALWYRDLDRFDQSRERFELHLRWARESGDTSSDSEVLRHLARLELAAGNWDLAERYADESIEAAEQMGLADPNPSTRVHALIDAHLGRLEAARRAAERGLEAATERDESMLAAIDLWTLGLVAFSQGDLATADSRYADATSRLRAVGFRDPGAFRFGPDHAEAVIGSGDLERADALLADLERANATIPRPWLAAGTERARGLLTAARGSLVEGIAILDAAAGREATAPFDRARTRYALAQLLRRANRRKDAEASLAAALETFERLGAAAWAGRARSEIARLGLRHGPDFELTPTERRVAELTASGMTNRQVAAALFISAKTVEANLARAYRKLGIRSRAELGRVMDGSPPREDGPGLLR